MKFIHLKIILKLRLYVLQSLPIFSLICFSIQAASNVINDSPQHPYESPHSSAVLNQRDLPKFAPAKSVKFEEGSLVKETPSMFRLVREHENRIQELEKALLK